MLARYTGKLYRFEIILKQILIAVYTLIDS